MFKLGPNPFMNFRTGKTCSWLMLNICSGYSFISPHFAIFIFLCFLFSLQASGRVKWPTVDASYYGGGGVGGITPVRVGVRPWLPRWFLVCNNYMTKISTCSRHVLTWTKNLRRECWVFKVIDKSYLESGLILLGFKCGGGGGACLDLWKCT